MSGFSKSHLFPVLFLIVFSAQECGDTLIEEITVRSDAAVEVAFEHAADSISFLLDGDPPPSLEIGWDSVHLGLTRRDRADKYVLRAWNTFPPGADLPPSYARPGDHRAGWYIQFPTHLTRKEMGDTLFFHFERTYLALDWMPTELFAPLLDRQGRVGKRMAAFDLENRVEAIAERYGDSVDLLNPETERDSLLAQEAQAEFLDILWEGNPTWVDLYREFAEDSLRIRYLDQVAFAIPAARSLIEGPQRGCGGDFAAILLEPLEEIEVSLEAAWNIFSSDFEMDLAASQYLDTAGHEGPAELEAKTLELKERALHRMEDTLLLGCGFTFEQLLDFNERFEWLNERYRIRNGKLRGQKFMVRLSMPGEVLETSADTVIQGKPMWRFSVPDFADEELTLTATSRAVGRNR